MKNSIERSDILFFNCYLCHVSFLLTCYVRSTNSINETVHHEQFGVNTDEVKLEEVTGAEKVVYANIEKIIRAVFALPKSFHILIIDDGSPDGTAASLQGCD